MMPWGPPTPPPKPGDPPEPPPEIIVNKELTEYFQRGLERRERAKMTKKLIAVATICLVVAGVSMLASRMQADDRVTAAPVQLGKIWTIDAQVFGHEAFIGCPNLMYKSQVPGGTMRVESLWTADLEHLMLSIEPNTFQREKIVRNQAKHLREAYGFESPINVADGDVFGRTLKPCPPHCGAVENQITSLM